jgi:hypothetical protein
MSDIVYFCSVTYTILLDDYRLMTERRFMHPNDPESYAGESVSFW